MESDSDAEMDDLDIEYSDSDSTFDGSSSDEETRPFQAIVEPTDGWTEIDTQTDTPEPQSPFEFTGKSFINEELAHFTRPYQFFDYFFDDDLVQKIVDQTNLFHKQTQKTTSDTSSKVLSQWSTGLSEMRTFFAVAMTMSVVQKPGETLYWTKKHTIITPFFRKIISYKRYHMLKKYLHFANNDAYNPATHPQPNLNKIWSVYTHLNKKFQQAYQPQKNVTIDESVMLYRKTGWVQNSAVKRARYGIKSYFLRESKSGYIWSSLMHTGKETIGDPAYMYLPISSQVVMNLIKPLLNKGHCLTVDDYYASIELAEHLVSQNTDIYGPLKASKSVPKQVTHPKKVSRGYLSACRQNRVMVLRWKDKRDELFISTIHGTNIVKMNKKMKPEVILDYNFSIGNTDRVNQHLYNYPVARSRGKRYYKIMFFHLMAQVLWNSYVLYTKHVGSMTHLEFRLQLIDDYVEKYHVPECSSKNERPGKNHNPLRLTERHFLEIIPITRKKTSPTKRCAVCCSKVNELGKRLRRETRYHCVDCNVGLCLTPCFQIYHTQLEFS